MQNKAIIVELLPWCVWRGLDMRGRAVPRSASRNYQLSNALYNKLQANESTNIGALRLKVSAGRFLDPVTVVVVI